MESAELGLFAVAGAVATQDTIKKLVGPTAEMLGEGIRNFAARRLENLNRVISNAAEKVGEDIERPGAVPMKVLKEVIEEGSLSDDPLVVDYFGGVLASARSPISRDDRGARVAKTLARMTSYQIRAHYIFYSLVKQLYQGKGLEMRLASDRKRMQTFIHLEDFATSMDYSAEELSKISSHYSDTMHGLSIDGLIHEDWTSGPKDRLKTQVVGAPEADGVIFTPSVLGAHLFLWAFGKGTEDANYLLNSDFVPSIKGTRLVLYRSRPIKRDF